MWRLIGLYTNFTIARIAEQICDPEGGLTMGRKRTPCDFCSGEYWPDGIDRRNGFYLWMEVYPFNNLIAVIAQANDENGEMIEEAIQIPMNFCPNCGRDLTKG